MKLNLEKLWGADFYNAVIDEGSIHEGFDLENPSHLLAVAIKIIGDAAEILAARAVLGKSKSA